MRFTTLMLSFAATVMPGIALAQSMDGQHTLDQQMQNMQARPAKASPATTAPAQWPVNNVAAPATTTTTTVTTAVPVVPAGMPASAVPAAPVTNINTTTTIQPAAVGTPVTGYTTPIDSLGGGAIPSLPLEVQSSNGVSYINGGVGDEEMAELKAKAAQFSLHVMLSDPKGEYISDVSLRLMDAKGVALVTLDDAGPYFYASLPAGNYTLETTTKGESVIKTLKFTVPAKGVVKQHIVYNQ